MEQLITIVMPVYNTAKFLERCIDSVLMQSYANWELVAVDDGSTDGSANVLDEYAATDSRIVVVHQSNSGVSAARNTGIDRARGQWLTFIDSDDTLRPDYLLNLFAAVESRDDIDAVVGGWTLNGAESPLPRVTLTRGKDYLRVFADGVNYGYVCSKLYRMSMIEERGLRFDRRVRWAEDAFYFYRVLLYARAVAVIDSCDYEYYSREGSGSVRLNSYDVELAGYEVARELLETLSERIDSRIIEHLTPYPQLLRVVFTLYDGTLDRRARLQRLRALDINPSGLKVRSRLWNERLYYRLITRRRWRLLDLTLSWVFRDRMTDRQH